MTDPAEFEGQRGVKSAMAIYNRARGPVTIWAVTLY